VTRAAVAGSRKSEGLAAAEAVYSLPARLAHWFTAAFIIFAFFVGLAMMRIGQGALQDELFDWHRSFGATVFALAALRLLWRLWHPAPPLPDMPAWMRVGAWLSHRLLYAFMLVMPIIGWLGSSAFGAPVHIYWLFDLPPLVKPDRALANVVLAIHVYGAFTLAALVVLHIGAALYHLVVRRDGVFRRMVG
jgi:cytochrome b561